MVRRTNTIIIVPHTKAKFYKFSFTTRTLVLAGIGAVMAVVLSVVALLASGSAVERRIELRRLERENAELREVNRRLEAAIGEVQAKLEEFEERTARLALAAGIRPDQTLLLGGDGGEGEAAGGPYDRVREAPEELERGGEWVERNLDRLEKVLTERKELLGATPTIAPVHGLFTDGFGVRRDPFTGRRARHRGLDIAARIGTPVRAPADGVVVSTERDRGYGKMVRISHGFGYVTVFGHLHRILVRPGQRVRRGDIIGEVGNTGRSTGPHLHYEVRKDGRAVNPLYYILDAS